MERPIRTIRFKDNNGLYVSLSDVYNFIVDNKILTKHKANKWIWDFKKKMLSDLLKGYKSGETYNFDEPLILSFNDYFINNFRLVSMLPDVPNDYLYRLKRQIDYITNCKEDISFLENSYLFQESILENSTFNFNRIIINKEMQK